MGKKKTEVEAKEPESNAPEEVEDPPIVKELKQIDDEYLKIEKEYEKAVQELQKKFTEKQQPFLDQRAAILKDKEKAENDTDKDKGTPALMGFWKKSLQNLPATEDQIEEWDEDVLDYCSDVTKSHLDEADFNKGFKLTFHFAENPFFENRELWKEYHLDEPSPYTGDVDVKEIKVSEIEWKAGKNVTVEIVSKKVKGGGAKKAKQKGKEKEEPRDSFFRNFFRHLKEGMAVPDDVNLEDAQQMMDDDDDDDQMMSLLMENDYEIGCCVRDQLIPFAVRWYTGEACPEDDDDDFDEDEEEDDDDDDEEESEDDDDDEQPPPRKGNKKKGGSGGGKAAGKGKEECKQQ